MATIAQIRGMLLEEAVLHLLRTAGYTVVENAGNDPTLHEGHSGLEIYGRGGKHQSDAVADFYINAPFTNPQRLVVEAKCLLPRNPVGLPIVRNAVGVIKDISEWWIPPDNLSGVVTMGRYHYQYAIFSASGFTSYAERYAFAQDIYLIPYKKSRFISPVIDAIRNLKHKDFGATEYNKIDINMTELRRIVRNSIKGLGSPRLDELPNSASTLIHEFVKEVIHVGGTLIAVAGRRFPIHLIPASDIRLSHLRPYYKIHIRWDDESWYLTDASNGQDLFSFDLPSELFTLYAEHGRLTESRALDLKSDIMNIMRAVLKLEEETRLITFELDKEWISRVRMRLQQLKMHR